MLLHGARHPRPCACCPRRRPAEAPGEAAPRSSMRQPLRYPQSPSIAQPTPPSAGGAGGFPSKLRLHAEEGLEVRRLEAFRLLVDPVEDVLGAGKELHVLDHVV